METTPVDLDRLREVHADHEANYEAVMRARDEQKKANERALREELRLQGEPQPNLPRYWGWPCKMPSRHSSAWWCRAACASRPSSISPSGREKVAGHGSARSR